MMGLQPLIELVYEIDAVEYIFICPVIQRIAIVANLLRG
jgi:hypothetical protein